MDEVYAGEYDGLTEKDPMDEHSLEFPPNRRRATDFGVLPKEDESI